MLYDENLSTDISWGNKNICTKKIFKSILL